MKRWSLFKKLIWLISLTSIVLPEWMNANDVEVPICIESLSYSKYDGFASACFGADGLFQGGPGCRQVLKLRNLSNHPFPTGKLNVDYSRYMGLLDHTCGIDGTSGDCSVEDSPKNIIYDPLPGFDPYETHSVYVGITSGVGKSPFEDSNITLTFSNGDTNITAPLKKCQIEHTAKDMCYDSVETDGLMCFDMGGFFSGGIGCKTTIRLRNQGDSNLSTPVVRVITNSLFSGHMLDSCGIDNQEGNCSDTDVLDGPFMGMSGLFLGNTVTYETMPDFALDGNHSTFTTSLMGMKLFSKTQMFGTYIKDGKLYKGVIQKCENFNCANPKEFSIIAQFNTRGNIKLIGNTNICMPKNNDPSTGECVDPGNTANNNINAIWKKGDGNSNTQNASAAKLALPDGAKILWAGLYWQGYFQYSNRSQLSAAQKTASRIQLGYTPEGTAPNLNNPPTVNYTPISADRLNHVYFSESRWYYQGFRDVTDYVKNHGNGWYWGADISTTLGEPTGGTLGAWSLAIIYYDPNESVKNLTVFDGYLGVVTSTDERNAYNYAVANDCPTDRTGTHNQTVIPLTGFRTPSNNSVDSRLILFAGEGDIAYQGDHLLLQDAEENYQPVDNAANPANNVANSSITDEGVARGSDTLYPYFGDNSIGIDIDTFNVSNIIENDQNRTKAKLDTVGDGYFPGVFGLATKLYIPQICYDYTIVYPDGNTYSKDPVPGKGIHLQSKNWSGRKLLIKVFLRSREGDLNFRNSTLSIRDLNQSMLQFNEAQLSPNSAYGYETLQGNDLNVSVNPSIAQIRIGEKDNDNIIGGTIGSDETYYARFYYDYNGSNHQSIDQFFNIGATLHLDFGSGPVPYTYSTDRTDEYRLTRCNTNPMYNPVPGIFNIERKGIDHTSPSESVRFPLYTQIAGKPFDVSVVSYEDSNQTQLKKVSDIGVEVELFDAAGFENNASTGYDEICNDYEPDRVLGHYFVDYSDTPAAVVDLDHVVPSKALRNAAFRIWYITDQNGTMVFDKTCYATHYSGDRDSCFAQEYHAHGDQIKSLIDPKGLCAGHCRVGQAGGCYECLKTHFGHPVCSRDNFAIRPAGFLIELYDTNNSNTQYFIADNNATLTPPALSYTDIAAGYSDYNLSIKARDYNNTQTVPGYYAIYDTTYRPGINEEYNLSFVLPQVGSLCQDSSDKPLNSRKSRFAFNNGIASDLNLTVGNTGHYHLWLLDKDWTLVDQQDYRWETKFDNKTHADCLKNSVDENRSDRKPNVGKYGCFISSKVPHYGTKNIAYANFKLNVRPYKFGLASLSMHTRPRGNVQWVYDNNLTEDINRSAPTFPPKVMAVTVEGNLTALGADGTILSNFTDHCEANDVLLHMDTNITGNPIRDTRGNTVSMQQILLQYLTAVKSLTYSPQPLLTADQNITLSKWNFRDDNDINGSAKVVLLFNLEKPYDRPINVQDINFTVAWAYGINDRSFANGKNNYLPEGNTTLGQIRYFYYAKVAPSIGTDNRQIVLPNTATNTAIRVDVYCDDNGTGICGIYPGLDNSPEEGFWYRAIGHSSALGDGNISVINSTCNGITPCPGITLNGAQFFRNLTIDSNGSSRSFSIGYPANLPRPKHPRINIVPTPWLKYSPVPSQNGIPFFTLHFLGGGLNWKGTGKTGHVIQTQPTPIPNKRLNW